MNIVQAVQFFTLNRITSLPLKRLRIALSCSFFSEKAISVSLSFNKTSLKHDSKSSTHSAILISLIPSQRNNLTPTCQTYQSNIPRRTNQKPRSWANGFSESKGLRASVPFALLPYPRSFHPFAPSHFSRGPNAKNSFAQPTSASCGNACYAG